MCFRYKVLGILSIAVAALTISLSPIKAAAEDKQAIPVPPNTEQVKKEARRIAASEFDFTYYASAQPAGQLKDFYRLRLTNSGWKEKTLLKDLEQIPGLQMEPALRSSLGQNMMMFEKEGVTLIINFLPEGVFPDQKTRFTVAQGKIGLQSAPSADTIPPIELLAKPHKEVAPTYPGAALISLSEPAGALTATYFTQDDINAVAAFYKNKMPNYGWSLVEEKAPEKLEMSQTSNMESWMAQLSFVNANQDTCNIILSQAISGQAGPAKMEMTTILVNYAEKKK